MENNQIYSSVDESLIDGTIFVVDMEENETSMRLKLKGEYSLRIWDGGLSLLTLNTEKSLYYWPFTVLRRYGTSKTGFTFEAGRKSHAGPGVLRFSSPSGKLITHTIRETVNKIKGNNYLPNTESNSMSLSPNVSSQLSEKLTGDYTKYSKTTDRPKRKGKPQEPHIELSLEIPGQYDMHRLTAGHSLSNPVLHDPPKERSNPPATYYNENFNRSGGATEFVDYMSLGETKSFEYNSSVDNSVLIDNYSLSALQGPSSLSAISNAPIPTPRAKSPSVPFTCKSFDRRLQLPDTLTSSADQLMKPEESISSTFPTCVSPLPKAHSSAEDSSSEDENVKKPASRKISQAQTTHTELNEDLELKAFNRSNPVSENYVNLRKENLTKTLSHPGEMITKGEFKLVGTEPHNYLNVRRQLTRESESDYYNVVHMRPEEKRRSYTDIKQKKNQQQRNDNFNFTPSYENRGDILDGPSSFTNMQNPISADAESQEILYANFQMHPSSRAAISEQVYVNTTNNFKPPFKRVQDLNKGSSVEESDYTFQSDISITHTTTLPIVSQVASSNPPLNPNPFGINTTQQARPRKAPRPYLDKKISSEYSYLTEILKPSPNIPQAYNTCRGLPTENK